MKSYTPRTVTAIIEIVIGLFLVLFGCYFLLSNLKCTPQAVYCAPMGAFVAILSLGPGCCILAAGIVCLRNTRFRFWLVQVTMIAAIFLYFGLLILAVSLMSP